MKASFAMLGCGYSQEVAERGISLAGRLGYDGIDLWKQYLDHADLDWVRGACEAQGLTILQICPYFDFTTSQQTYEETLREGERVVRYARTLGALYVRAFTGRTGSADATDGQWERAVRGLQLVCDMGAPFDVGVLLETHQVIHS